MGCVLSSSARSVVSQWRPNIPRRLCVCVPAPGRHVSVSVSAGGMSVSAGCISVCSWPTCVCIRVCRRDVRVCRLYVCLLLADMCLYPCLQAGCQCLQAVCLSAPGRHVSVSVSAGGMSVSAGCMSVCSWPTCVCIRVCRRNVRVGAGELVQISEPVPHHTGPETAAPPGQPARCQVSRRGGGVGQDRSGQVIDGYSWSYKYLPPDWFSHSRRNDRLVKSRTKEGPSTSRLSSKGVVIYRF